MRLPQNLFHFPAGAPRQIRRGYLLDEWVRTDMQPLMRELGVGAFHVVGASLGSPHAAAVAATYEPPAAVLGVELYVGFAPASAEHDPLEGSILKSMATLRAERPLTDRLLSRHVLIPMLSFFKRGTDVERALRWQWEGACGVASRCLGARSSYVYILYLYLYLRVLCAWRHGVLLLNLLLLRTGLYECVPLLTQSWEWDWTGIASRGLASDAPRKRVLIISAAQDTISSPKNQARLAAAIPGATLVSFEGEHDTALKVPAIMTGHLELLLGLA
jgi:pimeloyl-ACP methyl ester carboxylesterase